MYFNPLSIIMSRQSSGLSNYERLQAIQCWLHQLKASGGPRFIEAFQYFSVWTVLVYPIPFQTRLLQLVKMNMILQTCLGGFYITYVHPKIIHVHYLQLDLDRLLLQLIDFFAHHSLFLLYPCIFDNVFPPVSGAEYWIINLPFFIYCLSYDIHHKYGLSYHSDMIVLFFLYHLILVICLCLN